MNRSSNSSHESDAGSDVILSAEVDASLPSAASQAASRLTQGHDESSMEAVRTLLFGKRSKEIDDEFQKLSTRLSTTLDEMEEKMRSRFDTVEEFIRGEINTTNERVDSTRDDLDVRDSKAGERMNGLGQALDDRFSQLEAHVDKLETETQSSVAAQSKDLNETIEAEINRLGNRIDAEISNLSDASTHRSQLCESLIELAVRIDPTSSHHLNTGSIPSPNNYGENNREAVDSDELNLFEKETDDSAEHSHDRSHHG